MKKAALLSVVVLLLLAACGPGATPSLTPQQASPTSRPPSGEKKVIGVVSICGACTGQARAIESYRAEAAKRGWEVQVVDMAGDLSKAIAGFENFIASGVDALIDGAIDTELLTDVIAKANQAGIPFLVESGFWIPGVTCMVGQDSFRMGQVQGTYMVDRMQGKGNVVMLTARPARNVAMREDIVRTILGEYENIKILETHEIDFANPVADARRTMETWLTRYPNPGDITAVWCGWDDPCMGAAAAIDAAGRKEIFLIGNDAGPEAMELICGDSAFDATVYVDYTTLGKVMFEQLDKIFATGKPDARNVYIELPIVSRADCPPNPPYYPPLPPVSVYILYRSQ